MGHCGSADVAQQAEHLICNQDVAGSIPVVGSNADVGTNQQRQVGMSPVKIGSFAGSSPAVRSIC